MISSTKGTTTHVPVPNFRVLCTDWEAECYVECWTDEWDSALAIARSLDRYNVTIQIDFVVTMEGE